jgi:hypothetical protein
VYRDAAFPNGKPITIPATGIHNLGLIVELAALAEHSPTELTPTFLDERFATAVCRRADDKNKKLISFEKELKGMVQWVKEAFEGKHDGEIYNYTMPPWKAGSVDQEIVSISVYLEAKNGRIVNGKVHIVLED